MQVLDRPTQSTIWQNIRGASFMPRRPAAGQTVAGAAYAPRAGGSIWRNIRNSFMPRQPAADDDAPPPVPPIPAEYAELAPPVPPKSLAALRNIPAALRAGSRRTSEEGEEVLDGTKHGQHPNGSIPTISIQDTDPQQRLPTPQYDERDGERASWI